MSSSRFQSKILPVEPSHLTSSQGSGCHGEGLVIFQSRPKTTSLPTKRINDGVVKTSPDGRHVLTVQVLRSPWCSQTLYVEPRVSRQAPVSGASEPSAEAIAAPLFGSNVKPERASAVLWLRLPAAPPPFRSRCSGTSTGGLKEARGALRSGGAGGTGRAPESRRSRRSSARGRRHKLKTPPSSCTLLPCRCGNSAGAPRLRRASRGPPMPLDHKRLGSQDAPRKGAAARFLFNSGRALLCGARTAATSGSSSNLKSSISSSSFATSNCGGDSSGGDNGGG